MRSKLFSIHDVKAGAYLPPFWLPTIEMARRSFADCVNMETHAFAKHPEDYTLFHVGDFDDETGRLEPVEPVSFGNGVDFRRE